MREARAERTERLCPLQRSHERLEAALLAPIAEGDDVRCAVDQAIDRDGLPGQVDLEVRAAAPRQLPAKEVEFATAGEESRHRIRERSRGAVPEENPAVLVEHDGRVGGVIERESIELGRRISWKVRWHHEGTCTPRHRSPPSADLAITCRTFRALL